MRASRHKWLVRFVPTATISVVVVLYATNVTARSPAGVAAESPSIPAVHPQAGSRQDIPSLARDFQKQPKPTWRLALARIGSESLPLAMTATPDHLILVAADRSVIAVDARSHEVRWRRDRSQLGLTPRLVVARDSVSVAIFGEPAEPPLILRSTDGTELLRWPPAGQLPYQSGCFLRNASILATVDSGSSLHVHDSVGVLLRRIQLPWPAVARSHPLLKQLLLAGNAQGALCVGALPLGNGIAAFSDTGVLWTTLYREHFQPPRVRVRRSRGTGGTVITESSLDSRARAARELAAGENLAYVAFEGATEFAGRMVDLYELASGAYVATLLFDQVIRAIAASQTRLYVAQYDSGYPVVSAHDVKRR